eukprot:1887248-Heterocapsa_arctica.AAC.1
MTSKPCLRRSRDRPAETQQSSLVTALVSLDLFFGGNDPATGGEDAKVDEGEAAKLKRMSPANLRHVTFWAYATAGPPQSPSWPGN